MSANSAQKSSTFSSIKLKLIVCFLLMGGLFILLILTNYIAEQKRESLHSINRQLADINFYIQKAQNLENKFFIEETISDEFYQTGRSVYVAEHQEVIRQLRTDIDQLQADTRSLDIDKLTAEAAQLRSNLNFFQEKFEELVQLTLKRGFKDYGYTGEMRDIIHRVFDDNDKLNRADILQVRRREKDYIIRKDPKYVQMVEDQIELLKEQTSVYTDPAERQQVLADLEQYLLLFKQIVAADKAIGFHHTAGLRATLKNVSDNIQAGVATINASVNEQARQNRKLIAQVTTVLLALFAILGAVLAYLATRSISKPISALAGAVRNSTKNDFSLQGEIPHIKRRDEIGRLARDFAALLDQVKQRTTEVLQQKEEVTLLYNNVQQLGVLGQQVTSSLSADRIIEVASEGIATVAGATTFGIGLLTDERDNLLFTGAHKNGALLAEFSVSTEENNIFNRCLKNKEGIYIKDILSVGKEMQALKFTKLEAGNQSIICFPLIGKDSVIGLLTVQHKQANFYSPNQYNLIRNLAIYIEIALDNAQLYTTLEMRVMERTSEVMEQKMQIEKQKENLEKAMGKLMLLNNIGRALTSNLTIRSIIAEVYQHLNEQLEVPIFGIGLYNKQTQLLEFEGVIEYGETLPPYEYDVNEPNNHASYCFRTGKEIYIQDLQTDFDKYEVGLEEHLRTQQGMPRSIIYLPLIVKEQKIGVIAIQHMEPLMFDEQALELLRNMGNFAAIALENAIAFDKIERQRQRIERQNTKITSSISYAKRIQQALVPDPAALHNLLPGSFLYQRPRDLVSGDFFWYKATPQRLYMAAVDCTGHGVPGAFMSMIGSALLDRLVKEERLVRPADILDRLRTEIRLMLHQDEGDSRDGMDIALVVWEPQYNQLHFAGAGNPLLYFQNNELYRIKGDNIPIGGTTLRKTDAFQQHTIDTSTPTSFFLFSDGFQDQFGINEKGAVKKFSKKRFYQLLHDSQSEADATTATVLEQQLLSWQADQEQTDDILVFGARLPVKVVKQNGQLPVQNGRQSTEAQNGTMSAKQHPVEKQD